MKQIIPFKKDLLFKTKVSEVTSISLEHDFKIDDDMISGEFYISGDYKMTDGSIRRENFDFTLPFDIALDSRYQKDSMVVDIDNFYYRIINNDTLQVNIDLFVDGEKCEEEKEVELVREEPVEVKEDDIKFEDLVEEINDEEKDERVEEESLDIEDVKDIEMVKPERVEEIMDNKIVGEKEVEESKNINQNVNVNQNTDSNNFNIFDNVSDSDTYKAYHVYIVKEDDTIDKILEKYDIGKEEVSMYNELDNIKVGDKIIIPSKNE